MHEEHVLGVIIHARLQHDIETEHPGDETDLAQQIFQNGRWLHD
jgi:hypothetical protein